MTAPVLKAVLCLAVYVLYLSDSVLGLLDFQASSDRAALDYAQHGLLMPESVQTRRRELLNSANAERSDPHGDSAYNMCRKMKLKHGVQAGSSWGTLPAELQTLWTTLGCNEQILGKFVPGDAENSINHMSRTAAAVEDSHHERNPHSSVHGDHVTDDYVRDIKAVPAAAIATKATPAPTSSADSGGSVAISATAKRTSSADPSPSLSLRSERSESFREKRKSYLRQANDPPSLAQEKAKEREKEREREKKKEAMSPQHLHSGAVVNADADADAESGFAPGAEEDEFSIALPKIRAEDAKWCLDNKIRHGVIPQKSWGTLPEGYIPQWKSRRCDMSFTVVRMKKNPLVKCEDSNFQNADKLPLISVLAASTTRKMTVPSTKRMSLFNYLLPSLIRSIDCGYRYEYVLGYDAGDPFFDSVAGMQSVDKWFIENIVKPMAKRGVLILPMRKVRVNNTLRKPGPVFLEMARSAYEGGADYLYRVNDDTEFVDKWPNVFVKALQAIPGKVGAVGPTCTQGNTGILTHDFVARVHMDIMQMNYYPPPLVDWWMDDWISFVYGSLRTFKAANVFVVHHTGAHGRRYEVDSGNFLALNRLINEGRSLIRNHLLKSGVADAAIRAFDGDEAKIFVHKNVPAG